MTDPLSTAREKRDDLLEYYRMRDAGYHPECEPRCVSEAAELVPELIDQAERSQAMTICAQARGNFYKDRMEFGKPSFWIGDDAPDFVEHEHASRKDLDVYCELAASELAAEASAWRKIDPATQEALRWAIELMGDCQGADVLRKLLEGQP